MAPFEEFYSQTMTKKSVCLGFMAFDDDDDDLSFLRAADNGA